MNSRFQLSSTDVERIKRAVLEGLVEATKPTEKETPLAVEPLSFKEKVKVAWRVFRTPTEKLNVENSAMTFVKMIISLICTLAAWGGYLLSIFLFFHTGYSVCVHFSFATILLSLAKIMAAVSIALISKVVEAMGVEIEQSKDNNMIFGVSTFFISLASLIICLLSLLATVLLQKGV